MSPTIKKRSTKILRSSKSYVVCDKYGTLTKYENDEKTRVTDVDSRSFHQNVQDVSCLVSIVEETIVVVTRKGVVFFSKDLNEIDRTMSQNDVHPVALSANANYVAVGFFDGAVWYFNRNGVKMHNVSYKHESFV